ncbi:hypothetical protein D1614_17855 [Maribellus luteus]|uniref:Uncharacterized protein n=1 Tax=Maribellus luteus TaxID=2305463 RepID=A0A399SRY5_9BACT|nr:Ig-like domain-containing protein [Maribellus luteus]RIJ46540.1 hypothetical protein D1614_17855 [Maribellus luteus]
MKITNEKTLLAVIYSCIIFVGCVKEDNNIKPTIMFLQPQNNSEILEDSVLRIIVVPNDEDGSISEIELFLDEKLLKCLTVTPYQFDWDPDIQDIGLHVLKAVAYDDKNAKGESELQINIGDYREFITGDYNGIQVNTIMGLSPIYGSYHDTSTVTVTISMSQIDSIVDLDFTPDYPYENIPFKYTMGSLFSIEMYHSPYLKIINDSLYYKHRPGLGPSWTEVFAKKIE